MLVAKGGGGADCEAAEVSTDTVLLVAEVDIGRVVWEAVGVNNRVVLLVAEVDSIGGGGGGAIWRAVGINNNTAVSVAEGGSNGGCVCKVTRQRQRCSEIGELWCLSSSNCSPPSRISYLRLCVGVVDSRKGDSSNFIVRL